MFARWHLWALLPIVVVLALVSTAQGIIAQLNSFQPPPLNTGLLHDYSESARIREAGPHLWFVDDLPVVVARGTPFEMGLQYGRALADDIRAGLEAYLVGRVEKSQGYSLDYQRRCAESMARHIPEEYIEEMRGLAEGAGVEYDAILRIHTHADMVHYGKSWGRPDAAPGKDCTNFAVWGRWTVDGHLIHGRNLDWTTSTGIQKHACIYVGIPDRGVPFALVTYAGCIGAVTGMNAAAITFGEMTASSCAETLDGLPLMFVCRQILQYCKTIEDAEHMVVEYPRTTGWNFVIADGKVPTARAFEVDAEKVVIFKPNDPAENDPPIHWPMPDCIRRTNHYISRQMQPKQARRVGVPLVLARLAIRSIDTWQRYAALSHWIKTNQGHIDPRMARAFLQTAPVAGEGNLHSVVFQPAKKRMWVANASWKDGHAEPAWKQHYVFVDLSRFWPRTPSQTASWHFARARNRRDRAGPHFLCLSTHN
jgi:predicted choloylglycine hydrolase